MYIRIMFMQQHFQLIGKLADFKIGDHETDWDRRTFRGSKWENEVAEHFNDWDLKCEYKKILVNNRDEHNDAFELLEMWLDNSFKKYKEVRLTFIYEKVGNKLIKDEIIDIDNIEEFEIDENNFIQTKLGAFKTRKMDIAFLNKINELVQAVKQLNKEIKSIKEK